MTYLGNARIRLGWIKEYIGIKGNETADTLAKEATRDGTPANLPFPNSYLRNKLLQLSLSRWQVEWDNGDSGRSVYNIISKTSNKQLHWFRKGIQFATGHGSFPSFLKIFDLHPTDDCGYGEIPYTTQQDAHLLHHTTTRNQAHNSLSTGGRVPCPTNSQDEK
ncbi:hypothetical protein AVEN_182567-1 [Araneus ventricosus]|uniref:RNase H type-1 domain-containing protein n=1 Tax=Araneus ventricosus TaxID=182803 RepID=A0A4Y2JRH2_ARAVE|nr:hypothetical protein AVEN_182567-1 [Araneus ventricosus]